MSRNRHVEELVVAVFQLVEGGGKLADVYLKAGISEGTLCRWKKQ